MLIYQLYFDGGSQSNLQKHGVAVDTSLVTTPFFENHFISELPKPETGYFGVLSHRFLQKTGCTIPCKKSNRTKADIYSPYTQLGTRLNLWQQGQNAHKHLYEIAAVVLRDAGLNIKILSLPTFMIYCNFWVMRVELVHEFVGLWLNPVMEACKKNADLVMQPCHYNPSHGKASPQQLIKATGLPYYSYAPFICERLIGSFVYHKHLNLEPWHNLT